MGGREERTEGENGKTLRCAFFLFFFFSKIEESELPAFSHIVS